MINIVDKSTCCGCTACKAVCPKQCISMKADKDGCFYPQVDLSLCIDCHLCEKVCPELADKTKHRPTATYAAQNNDDTIRRNSSSGGIFSLLAEDTILKGGVVYGARYTDDFLSVEHSRAETIDQLAQFRGSKYLQSQMSDIFTDVKKELLTGRQVLFSGTPCQVAGLNNFLRKKYENLATVDFVCHGVPAPYVWQSYIDSIKTPIDTISLASMRDKTDGWKKFRMVIGVHDSSGKKKTIVDEPFGNNKYMQAFLSNMCLRPACYKCPAKGGESGSDITIGDFWGIDQVDPSIDDDKGLSLVMVHTEKGRQLFDRIKCAKSLQDYDKALRYNPSIEHSVSEPVYRRLFMTKLEHSGFKKAYSTVFSQKFVKKVCRRLWRAIHTS